MLTRFSGKISKVAKSCIVNRSHLDEPTCDRLIGSLCSSRLSSLRLCSCRSRRRLSLTFSGFPMFHRSYTGECLWLTCPSNGSVYFVLLCLQGEDIKVKKLAWWMDSKPAIVCHFVCSCSLQSLPARQGPLIHFIYSLPMKAIILFTISDLLKSVSILLMMNYQHF